MTASKQPRLLLTGSEVRRRTLLQWLGLVPIAAVDSDRDAFYQERVGACDRQRWKGDIMKARLMVAAKMTAYDMRTWLQYQVVGTELRVRMLVTGWRAQIFVHGVEVASVEHRVCSQAIWRVMCAAEEPELSGAPTSWLVK